MSFKSFDVEHTDFCSYSNKDFCSYAFEAKHKKKKKPAMIWERDREREHPLSATMHSIYLAGFNGLFRFRFRISVDGGVCNFSFKFFARECNGAAECSHSVNQLHVTARQHSAFFSTIAFAFRKTISQFALFVPVKIFFGLWKIWKSIILTVKRS